jgi:hypothetical protein
MLLTVKRNPSDRFEQFDGYFIFQLNINKKREIPLTPFKKGGIVTH